MKRMNLKRKIAAMMCAMMTFSCAVPAAFAEDLVTLLTPEETKALFDSYKALQDQMESAAAALSGESAQQENPGDQDTAQDTQKKQETAFLSSGPVFNEFTLSAKEKDGTITVTLAGNSPYEIEVVLSGAASAKDWILDTNGSVSFSGLSAGDYTIKASYVSKPSISAGASVKIEAADEDDGNSGGSGSVDSITPPSGSGSGADAITPPGSSGSGAELITPPTVTYSAELTAFSVTDTDEGKEEGAVSGTVSFTGDLDMVAKLYDADGGKIAEKTLLKGGDGSFAFSGLAAGDYKVSVYFYGKGGETPPVSKSFTVQSNVPLGSSTVSRFTLNASQNSGAITAQISGASNREIEIVLLDKDGKEVASSYTIGNDSALLGTFAAGEYTVRAYYVTPSVDADGNDIEPVTAKVTVPAGTQAAPEITYIDIEAKIDTGSDYVIVTVSKAADAPMYLFFGDYEPRAVKPGDTVRFDKLTPGKYEVEIDYEAAGHGASPFRGTATIADPAALKAVAITQVVGGENQLVVTGSAQENTEITLTTEPASVTAVVKTDASGHFSAAITCEPGTYTKVTAGYSSGLGSKATFSGSFTVSAPTAKPTLTVDPVDTESKTVVAKTTAGVTVTLKTSDYTQTETADSNGLVRFTLPHTYLTGDTFTFTVYYGAGNSQSFTQTVTVAKASKYDTLEKGDKGDDVYALTSRLSALGYPVKAQKKYDDSVVTAVSLFQQINGLKVTGVASNSTQAALYSVGAIPYSTSSKYPTFVRGDRDHPLIYAMQRRLKDLGYYTIKVDGIFGSGTQRAVRDFQKVNGLSVTGKADSAMQTLLYSAAAKPADYVSPGSYKTLVRSSKYQSAVVPLQRRLKALGYYTGSIDGYFGSKTYRAVRSFQSRNGISVTGKADPYTQEVLYSSYARPASGSSSSSSSSSSDYRLLYWGCEGSAVKRLQNALISAGYKSLVRTADGIYGQWTYDAVRAYQKDHGLSVDGIAGKNTQNSLYGTNY